MRVTFFALATLASTGIAESLEVVDLAGWECVSASFVDQSKSKLDDLLPDRSKECGDIASFRGITNHHLVLLNGSCHGGDAMSVKYGLVSGQ